MTKTIDLSLATSEQIEGHLCAQLAQIRVARNISQSNLAHESGVAVKTIGRMERGEGVSLDTFIRVMKALGFTGHLQALLPDPSVRPMERIGRAGVERKRSRRRVNPTDGNDWTWGNEKESGR